MGDKDNGQIHRMGDGRYAGIGLEPVNLTGLRMNRIDRAGIAHVLEGHEKKLTHLHPPGQTHDGD